MDMDNNSEFLKYIEESANKDFIDMILEKYEFTVEDLENRNKELISLLPDFVITEEDIEDYLAESKKSKGLYDCSCLPEDYTEEDFKYDLSLGIDDNDLEQDLGFV